MQRDKVLSLIGLAMKICFYGDKDTLGHAMGKEFRASLAILDEGFAAGIQKELKNRESIA